MKTIRSRIIAAMLAAVALCLSACTFGGDDEPDYDATTLAVGTTAPVFTMYTDEYPDGISLAQLRGGYVLVEFWRSGCRDCQAVTERMKELYDTYAPQGITFVGVSFDTDVDAWRTYVEDNGLDWMQHYEQKSASESAVAAAYNIRWVPTFYLIDPEGNVAFATISIEKMADELRVKSE